MQQWAYGQKAPAFSCAIAFIRHVHARHRMARPRETPLQAVVVVLCRGEKRLEAIQDELSRKMHEALVERVEHTTELRRRERLFKCRGCVDVEVHGEDRRRQFVWRKENEVLGQVKNPTDTQVIFVLLFPNM